MAGSDSQIDKPQRGRPERAELPDVNINTGAKSINTDRASLNLSLCLEMAIYMYLLYFVLIFPATIADVLQLTMLMFQLKCMSLPPILQ